MPANPELEKIHIYNLPKGTKKRIKKAAQKHKSVNTYLVKLLTKKSK